jgi:hypothetical protein
MHLISCGERFSSDVGISRTIFSLNLYILYIVGTEGSFIYFKYLSLVISLYN